MGLTHDEPPTANRCPPELSFNKTTETMSPIKHMSNSIPMGTCMYPRQTHAPTHALVQSSGVTHVCSEFDATHASLRVSSTHEHVTPELSIAPYTCANNAIAVYPTVSFSPDANPRRVDPQISTHASTKAVHVKPCAHPRNNADIVTTPNPPLFTRVAIIPNTGAITPTLQPSTVTRRRPYASAQRPTAKFALDFASANGNRNDTFTALEVTANSRPALSIDASLCSCNTPPSAAVSAMATPSCAAARRENPATVDDDISPAQSPEAKRRVNARACAFRRQAR
mmetsp:Transcript_6774/g.22228  ORF Transcript_6774/g.22228 Transcript_6774/m.22228 type:complete len:283 (+) Transcript_6774:884-1732(+)